MFTRAFQASKWDYWFSREKGKQVRMIDKMERRRTNRRKKTYYGNVESWNANKWWSSPHELDTNIKFHKQSRKRWYHYPANIFFVHNRFSLVEPLAWHLMASKWMLQWKKIHFFMVAETPGINTLIQMLTRSFLDIGNSIRCSKLTRNEWRLLLYYRHHKNEKRLNWSSSLRTRWYITARSVQHNNQ